MIFSVGSRPFSWHITFAQHSIKYKGGRSVKLTKSNHISANSEGCRCALSSPGVPSPSSIAMLVISIARSKYRRASIIIVGASCSKRCIVLAEGLLSFCGSGVGSEPSKLCA